MHTIHMHNYIKKRKKVNLPNGSVISLGNEHRQHLMKFDIPHVAITTTKQRTARIRAQADPVNETHTPPFTSIFHPSLL